jgi:hypothetical protein
MAPSELRRLAIVAVNRALSYTKKMKTSNSKAFIVVDVFYNDKSFAKNSLNLAHRDSNVVYRIIPID